MAWSDAARRAAAEARKRKSNLVARSNNYAGSVRGQVQARHALVKRGLHPTTGKKVGKKAALRAMAYYGDMSND